MLQQCPPFSCPGAAPLTPQTLHLFHGSAIHAFSARLHRPETVCVLSAYRKRWTEPMAARRRLPLRSPSRQRSERHQIWIDRQYIGAVSDHTNVLTVGLRKALELRPEEPISPPSSASSKCPRRPMIAFQPRREQGPAAVVAIRLEDGKKSSVNKAVVALRWPLLTGGSGLKLGPPCTIKIFLSYASFNLNSLGCRGSRRSSLRWASLPAITANR